MKVEPLGDNVLVKRLEAEEKSAGGIFLPEMAREKPRTGEVLAVGKGRTLSSGAVVAITVKVGDKVLFSSYGGTEVTVDGNEYMLMSEDDIMAVVK